MKHLHFVDRCAASRAASLIDFAKTYSVHDASLEWRTGLAILNGSVVDLFVVP